MGSEMCIRDRPYDAVAMLETLGPVYYLIVGLELAMWAGLLFMGWTKLSRARRGAKAVASTA